MTVAIAPTPINYPVGVRTAQRFRVHLYTGESWTTRATSVSTTNGFRCVVLDPSGSTYGYSLTASTLSAGKCFFTLTAGNHLTSGSASWQLHRNGRMLGRFAFDFVAYL